MLNSRPPSDQPGTILVSKCLVGHPCRYDGKTKSAPQVKAFLKRVESQGLQWTPVCPEELGGLGTPRPAAHLLGGDGNEVWQNRARVTRVEDGGDVTQAFMTGAQRALDMGGEHILCAILKARSPSCGSGETTIEGKRTRGDGVFTALLKKNRVHVTTDENMELPRSIGVDDGE
jgi:uncharacterized protein YbbK (DUF523 family)